VKTSCRPASGSKRTATSSSSPTSRDRPEGHRFGKEGIGVACLAPGCRRPLRRRADDRVRRVVVAPLPRSRHSRPSREAAPPRPLHSRTLPRRWLPPAGARRVTLRRPGRPLRLRQTPGPHDAGARPDPDASRLLPLNRLAPRHPAQSPDRPRLSRRPLAGSWRGDPEGVIAAGELRGPSVQRSN
jgi:hypothetical protein